MSTVDQRLRRGQQLEAAAGVLERALRDAGLGPDWRTDVHPRWSVRLVEELVAAGVLALPEDRGA